MIRRPPRSTLFPYTRSSDLSRASCQSLSDAAHPLPRTRSNTGGQVCAGEFLPAPQPQKGRPRRSEEHTSELQSLTNLVCRLLLEKKKNKKVTTQSDINRK